MDKQFFDEVTAAIGSSLNLVTYLLLGAGVAIGAAIAFAAIKLF